MDCIGFVISSLKICMGSANKRGEIKSQSILPSILISFALHNSKSSSMLPCQRIALKQSRLKRLIYLKNLRI